MPRLTVAGHPLHAVLSDWPVALLSSVAAFDALYLATGKRPYASTAHHLQTGGLYSGLLVGLAGAADYTTIKDRDAKMKSDARAHALINIGIMALTAVSLKMRKRREVPSGKSLFFFSALSAIGLIASAWYGGELVYQHGMRVKGVSPVDDSPEFEVPGSKRAGELLSKWSEPLEPRAMH